MTLRRLNEVEVIARLAPRTIAFLQIPLTPARAARLADLVLRTGIDPQTLVIDLLDDMIFSLVECGGKASCTEHCLIESRKPEKSSARSCKALHDCASLPSEKPARDSGPTKPPKSSPRAPSAASEQPATSFQASESLRDDQSPLSSPPFLNGRFELRSPDET